MDKKQSKLTLVSPATTTLISMKTVKTYQPVSFNHKLDTFFTAARSGMEGLTIEFCPEHQLIHMRQPGGDYKIIVPANIQYMEPA
jgi:hypothetical protein